MTSEDNEANTELTKDKSTIYQL